VLQILHGGALRDMLHQVCGACANPSPCNWVGSASCSILSCLRICGLTAAAAASGCQGDPGVPHCLQAER
jgi:hypothetical protein